MRNNDKIIAKIHGKLSTFRMLQNRINVTYTPSYAHYPQKNSLEQGTIFGKNRNKRFVNM